MLMRGDMQKLIEHINPVFETAFNRIEALGDRVEELEEIIEALKAGSDVKRGPGRPPKVTKENAA
jgi:hypothetical protein